MEMYLVTYVRHNKSTGGVSYKTEMATPDLAAAKKKYHALCGDNFNSDTFDFVSVVITDAFGNRIEGDYFSNIEPAPEPETTTE